jgi:cell division protein FtsB
MMADTEAESAPARGVRARLRPNTQDLRDRRRRLLAGALWLVLGTLLVNAIVGEDGYLATVKARHEEAALQREVAALRLENQQLQEAARRLQNDATAVEQAARDMNFIYPGETLVIVHDAAPAGSPSAH